MKEELALKQKLVLREVSRLRREMEDLTDYLDILEARAKNASQPKYSPAQIRKKLKLESA